MLEGFPPNSIEIEERVWLEWSFEKRVVGSLRHMEWDKASCQDGLTMALFQHCWNVVKEDIM